jgi:pimeloyl-ACP methyl ester carboxylesterase
MDAATARVNGIRMHYRRAGEGPAVVLLHGWPQTWYCWRKVIDELAADHTVIAPDLRGYGRTDKPRDGYDKRTMAADVSLLVSSLGFEKVSVVGHDRGGRVGHRCALDRPEQVERLAVGHRADQGNVAATGLRPRAELLALAVPSATGPA